MKKLILATVASVFVLTGCNTIKGFGQDVSKTGDAVSTTAQKVENKM
ncbi:MULTISPECIES: entericidin A/B family lipoprotein [unclassified Moraxella]